MKSLLSLTLAVLTLSAVLVIRTASAGPAATPPAATQADGGTQTIGIDNFSFNAKSVTVRAGTEVIWVNHDDAPHKVVSTQNTFASPVLDTDGRFSYTFTKPGTYEYFCSIHPMMTGTVVVK